MTIKFEKKYLSYYIITGILFLSMLISSITYLVQSKGFRKTFIFPSADTGKYILEYRFLPKNPVQGDINLFIDELLLGSGVERTKKLFAYGTKVNSCFVRDETLYVNLSAETLQMGNGVIDIKDGIDLLKKNIFYNFHKIKQIEVFVDGKYAFESK